MQIDWFKVITITIAVISLGVSCYTLISNHLRNKRNLDIEMLNFYPVDPNGTFIRLNIINKSINPISVTRLQAEESKNDVLKRLFLNEDPRLNFIERQKVPFKLEGYEAKEVLLFFYGLKIDDRTNYKFLIYTSRGTVEKVLNSENKHTYNGHLRLPV